MLAGNNLAAVATLELVLQRVAPADVLVIAPRGVAASWHASLAAAAEQSGVPCVTPDDVNDAATLERIERHEPDVLLSVYYTQLFGTRLLEALPGNAVNFHPSLLPRHRGVAPVIWAIAEGDTRTGVTVHHIDDGIDTGRIVLQRPLPIHPEDTGYRLHLKLARLVRATAAELLRGWFAGEPIPPGVEQSGVASYHGRNDPPLNRIDWSQPRARIRDVVRALAPPLPGAFTFLDGERLVIARVEMFPERGGRRRLGPGMVSVRGGEPIVWAVDGPLRLAALVDGDAVVPGQELARRGALIEGRVLG